MLIIEDGSIVAGADSLATAAELVTYAANFGRTIPATEAAQEAMLRRAALEMNVLPWHGTLVSIDQALAWPRYDVKRGNFLLPSNEIPTQIKAGQMALAAEIYADDLAPPEQKKGAVTKNRVEGAVEQQYAAAPSSVTRPAATRQSYAQFAGFMASRNQVRLVRG